MSSSSSFGADIEEASLFGECLENRILVQSGFSQLVGHADQIRTVHRALRRLGFSWTRPRRRLPPTDREKYQQRMAEVVEAIGEVGTETTVLFEDETERFPPLRRMWQPVGQQRAVDVPSNNEDFAFYGVVDVLEGGVYIERHPKKISEHTISFLESVLAQATGEVLLIWDQAPDYWTVCSLGSFIDLLS